MTIFWYASQIASHSVWKVIYILIQLHSRKTEPAYISVKSIEKCPFSHTQRGQVINQHLPVQWVECAVTAA